MKTTHIYGIRDLEIDKFIYIGKDNAPPVRFESHMKCSHNRGVRELVEEKGVDNFQNILLETVEFKVSWDWVNREKFWIKKLKKEGHPLCNKNDGGGGPTEHTGETKARMSKAKVGEKNPNYGRTPSEETRAKLSKSNTGKKRSEETCTKIGRASKGRKPSPETRAKMSKSHRGKPKSEEHKANISKALKGRKVTKETRAKQSKATKKYYETHDGYWKGKSRSEETKAKISRANSNPSDETRRKMSETSLGNENRAKSYPAFYNAKTDKFIPTGINLEKICREQGLSYGIMWNLKRGKSKQTLDGWRLATLSEIKEYSSA